MSNGLRWRVSPPLPSLREGADTYGSICFHSSEALFPPIGNHASTHWKGCFHWVEAKHHPMPFNKSSIEHQYIIDRTSIYHKLKTKTSSIGWNLLDNSAVSMYSNDSDIINHKPFTVNDCHHGSYMMRWRICISWYTLKIPLSYFLYSFSP